MAFGVDLGTTNSSIAWADDAGNVHSLRVRRGLKEPFDAVDRSLVLDPLGEEPVVGGEAETAAALAPEARLVRSFKRRFDKQRLRQRRYRHVLVPTHEYDPVEQGIRILETQQLVPIEYDRYSREEVISAGGRVFERLLTSSEIDAGSETMIVRTALDVLSGAGGTDQELLYVGVPVTFGPTGRRRLLAALVRSGCFGSGPKAYKYALERCRVVYEPLALMSTLVLFEPQDVLIVDYGGGTLDLACLRVSFAEDNTQTVTELALGGLTAAGDALDAIFRDDLLARRPKLKRAYERQIAGGSDWDLLQADSSFANAKIRLSTLDEVALPLFNQPVTRAELERAIAPEVEAVVQAVRDTLVRAELSSHEISTVVLTGGSSLIPLVQDRLRGEFPVLDDLSFRAADPGDPESALEALTGVSRGLARFGFMERFETAAVCDYTVVVPGVDGRIVGLPRGSADTYSLSEPPPVAVPVGEGPTATFALYSDLVREAYCGALVDVEIPDGIDELELRISASRARFVPAFSVARQGRTRPLASFDLDAMDAADLAAFVEGDCEWLPPQTQVAAAPLVRPLKLGDYVAWNYNGSVRSGQIIDIREISSAQHVEAIDGFDPAGYVIKVAREIDGEVHLGQTATPPWRLGDVRLV